MKPHIILAAALFGLAPLSSAVAQSSAPAAADVPAPPPGVREKSETALHDTIAAFQAGKPNFDDMETPLADAVRAQSGTLIGMMEQFGALKSLDYFAWNPKGQGIAAYMATFEKAKVQCLIGFGAGGKMQVLWFKPV